MCAICATMSCGGAGGGCGGGGGGHVRKVKVVKDKHGGEKWVIVEQFFRTTNENINQPDPNRQALFGVPTAGKLDDVHYTYGDELPKKITQATVCAGICSILATPLALICIIPMILNLNKVCM